MQAWKENPWNHFQSDKTSKTRHHIVGPVIIEAPHHRFIHARKSLVPSMHSYFRLHRLPGAISVEINHVASTPISKRILVHSKWDALPKPVQYEMLASIVPYLGFDQHWQPEPTRLIECHCLATFPETLRELEDWIAASTTQSLRYAASVCTRERQKAPPPAGIESTSYFLFCYFVPNPEGLVTAQLVTRHSVDSHKHSFSFPYHDICHQ